MAYDPNNVNGTSSFGRAGLTFGSLFTPLISPFGIPAWNLLDERVDPKTGKKVGGTLWQISTRHLGDNAKFGQKVSAYLGMSPAARAATKSGVSVLRVTGGAIGELFSPLGIALTGWEISNILKAPKQERLAMSAESIANMAAFPVGMGLGAAAAAGFGFPVVGHIVTAGVVIAGMTAGRAAYSTVKAIEQIGRQSKRLEFGGDFRDTQDLFTMRMRSVQEMSGSLLNARQYMANEAKFFHGT